jgi:hypothetical protein
VYLGDVFGDVYGDVFGGGFYGVLASPCFMRAVAAFRGFQLFCVRAWKVFVVASRLRRKCSSSCRVKPKWGLGGGLR